MFLAAPASGPDGGLPPYFAGMTGPARSALYEALGEAGGLIVVAGHRGSGRAATLEGLTSRRPDSLVVGDLEGPGGGGAALRAARGRLVRATIDCGDSITAPRRIAALGSEPFSIACVLRLVLAQRQVRRLCPSCRTPVQPPGSITAPLGLEPGAVVYRSPGCAACGRLGFAGAVGVFEALPVDPSVGRLIVCGADEAAIANHVFRTWPNLAAAARAVVIQGLATAEDAIQVLRSPRVVSSCRLRLERRG